MKPTSAGKDTQHERDQTLKKLACVSNQWGPLLIDSIILMFSVLAQFLLMRRRIETWICWLIVDTVAVPLYASRELYLTAFVYGLFWCNAWYGLYSWIKIHRAENAGVPA
ncbi:nicotinamide mononucleotide transporter family protein [Grimontia marina]